MEKKIKKNEKKLIEKKNRKKDKKKEINKNKNKKIIITFIILFLLILSSVFACFFYREKVKAMYSNSMITTMDKTIYKKEKMMYKKVGTIYKNNPVSLSKIEGKYFKLKNSNYYITYNHLEKTKEKKESSVDFVLFNENVVINKNSILYQEKKKYFKINQEIELPILQKDQNFYICLYENTLLKVKKKDVKEVKKANNTNKEMASSIPVLYFSEKENIEEKLKQLSEKKYYFMSLEEYKKWTNQNQLFPKKSVFLIFKEEFDSIKEFVKKYNIKYTLEKELELKFVENDAFSEPNKFYWYNIASYMTMDRFKDILNGVKLEKKEYAERIAVLNYHFFSKPGATCDETICLDDTKFEEQLKYLQENHYKTLTMEEYNRWLKGEIELPKKSVLLTVDDGALGTNTVLPDMLDKYNQKATLFLITSFWPMSKYRTGNLEIQSHSHSLHDRDFCYNGNCGIKTLVWSKEEILKDLKKSKEIIGGNPIAYCYPFYEHDEKTREAVKEEFALAFVGGNRKSTRSDNNYLIPRYVILSDITLNDFINMIS